MTQSIRRQLRRLTRDRIVSAEETARAILDERTQLLAARRDEPATRALAVPPVLVCKVGAEYVGIALSDVAEIVPASPCVPVPDGKTAVVGVLGRSGHVVSVIDLGLALGAGPAPDAAFEHYVHLRQDRPRIALRVERAQAITATAVAAPDGQSFRHEAVVGYAETAPDRNGATHIVSILDVERLISPFLHSFPGPGE